MIKLTLDENYNKLSYKLTEATLQNSLNNIIKYLSKSLANIGHPTHNIKIHKNTSGTSVIVEFEDTGISYEIKPKLLGTIDKSPQSQLSRHSVSVKANYPNAIYDPKDYSFYDNGVLIGTAYVSIPSKKDKDYSDDIDDAKILSNGRVSNVRSLLKKIGTDANPENRIP